jgi:hypothetical protein
MSALPKKATLPTVTIDEVKALKKSPDKPKVIFLRVPNDEHKAVQAAAKSLGLKVTDYLMKCHELVSSKLMELPCPAPSPSGTLRKKNRAL